jgi:flagella basal body P-ring formation protein FlgA
VVNQGDQVTIRLSRDSVTLTSPGQARRDGRIGDIIPVVVGVSGKRLMGRLVAPGIVLVE